jgi:hypothetical protein
MEAVPGVTAIETKAREFTFNVAEAVMVPRVAVIAVDPPLKPLANPAVVIPAREG